MGLRLNLLVLILLNKGFSLANLGEIGLFITGTAGFSSAVLSNRRAKRIEKNKASADSVNTLEGLVDRYRKEVARIDEKLDTVSIELESCKNDKIYLQNQINDLRSSRQ